MISQRTMIIPRACNHLPIEPTVTAMSDAISIGEFAISSIGILIKGKRFLLRF